MARFSIGAILDERGISSQEFSIMANISYNTALSLRRGVTTRIDMDVLNRVLKALRVSIRDVLVENESA